MRHALRGLEYTKACFHTVHDILHVHGNLFSFSLYPILIVSFFKMHYSTLTTNLLTVTVLNYVDHSTFMIKICVH